MLTTTGCRYGIHDRNDNDLPAYTEHNRNRHVARKKVCKYPGVIFFTWLVRYVSINAHRKQNRNLKMTDYLKLAEHICVDPLRDSGYKIGEALQAFVDYRVTEYESIPKLAKAIEQIFGKQVSMETLVKITEMVQEEK